VQIGRVFSIICKFGEAFRREAYQMLQEVYVLLMEAQLLEEALHVSKMISDAIDARITYVKKLIEDGYDIIPVTNEVAKWDLQSNLLIRWISRVNCGKILLLMGETQEAASYVKLCMDTLEEVTKPEPPVQCPSIATLSDFASLCLGAAPEVHQQFFTTVLDALVNSHNVSPIKGYSSTVTFLRTRANTIKQLALLYDSLNKQEFVIQAMERIDQMYADENPLDPGRDLFLNQLLKLQAGNSVRMAELEERVDSIINQPTALSLLYVLPNYTLSYLELGKPDKQLELVEKQLEYNEKEFGESDVNLLLPLAYMTTCQLLRDKPEELQAVLDRAVAIINATPSLTAYPISKAVLAFRATHMIQMKLGQMKQFDGQYAVLLKMAEWEPTLYTNVSPTMESWYRDNFFCYYLCQLHGLMSLACEQLRDVDGAIEHREAALSTMGTATKLASPNLFAVENYSVLGHLYMMKQDINMALYYRRLAYEKEIRVVAKHDVLVYANVTDLASTLVSTGEVDAAMNLLVDLFNRVKLNQTTLQPKEPSTFTADAMPKTVVDRLTALKRIVGVCIQIGVRGNEFREEIAKYALDYLESFDAHESVLSISFLSAMLEIRVLGNDFQDAKRYGKIVLELQHPLLPRMSAVEVREYYNDMKNYSLALKEVQLYSEAVEVIQMQIDLAAAEGGGEALLNELREEKARVEVSDRLFCMIWERWWRLWVFLLFFFFSLIYFSPLTFSFLLLGTGCS